MSIKTKKKDEGFTNIRIREETREELRAIGRYSENMDDIVRKCLAAYKAITSSGGRVVNKIVVEEPIKDQSQRQVMQASGRPGQPLNFPSKQQYQKLLQAIKNGRETIKHLRVHPPDDEKMKKELNNITAGIEDYTERLFVICAIENDTPEDQLPQLWYSVTPRQGYESGYMPPEEKDDYSEILSALYEKVTSDPEYMERSERRKISKEQDKGTTNTKTKTKTVTSNFP